MLVIALHIFMEKIEYICVSNYISSSFYTICLFFNLPILFLLHVMQIECRSKKAYKLLSNGISTSTHPNKNLISNASRFENVSS